MHAPTALFPPQHNEYYFPQLIKYRQLTYENQLLPPIAYKQQSAVMTQIGSVYPPLEARPLKNTICLFDVDNTLGPARRVCTFPIHTWPLVEPIHDILPLLKFTESLQ